MVCAIFTFKGFSVNLFLPPLSTTSSEISSNFSMKQLSCSAKSTFYILCFFVWFSVCLETQLLRGNKKEKATYYAFLIDALWSNLPIRCLRALFFCWYIQSFFSFSLARKTKSVEREDRIKNLSLLAFTHIWKEKDKWMRS